MFRHVATFMHALAAAAFKGPRPLNGVPHEQMYEYMKSCVN